MGKFRTSRKTNLCFTSMRKWERMDDDDTQIYWNTVVLIAYKIKWNMLYRYAIFVQNIHADL